MAMMMRRGIQRMVAGSSLRRPFASPAHGPPPPAEPSPYQSTRKVSDRLIKLTAVDHEGSRHVLPAMTGATLLKALTNNRLIDPFSHHLEDLFACSAECQVMIAQEWLDKLPPRSPTEMDILKAAAGKDPVDPHARLSCQIELDSALDGMVVAVPEEKPWDLP